MFSTPDSLLISSTSSSRMVSRAFPLISWSTAGSWFIFSAGIYLPKFKNRNVRTSCEICSKFTIKTPERRQWRRSGVFIVNIEHISHLFLMFLLLTLNMQLPAGFSLSVNACHIFIYLSCASYNIFFSKDCGTLKFNAISWSLSSLLPWMWKLFILWIIKLILTLWRLSFQKPINKQNIDCNWTRIQNHLVLKLGQFGQMVECSFKN